MAAKWLTWAEYVPLERCRRAPVYAQRVVLLMLASHADAGGTSWPSVQGMAERAGMPRSTVQVALTALAAAGLIALADGARSIGGQGNTTRWQLPPDTANLSKKAAARWRPAATNGRHL